MTTGPLVLPNLIQDNLKILFIGINPGLHSAAIGHHFAGHSNRFWRLLAAAQLTPVVYPATEDYRLMELGYGITNLVPRPSAKASELTPEEFREGVVTLRDLLLRYKPQIAAYVGKIVYQYLSSRRDFGWGLQNSALFPGIDDFVLPNPSGLNRMPYQEILLYYSTLQQFVNSKMSQGPQ